MRIIEKTLPLFLAGALALTGTACGNKDNETPAEEEIVLAPLEEKKLSPAEEAEIAEPEPDSVGNMMVYPSGFEGTGCLYGTNTITFYFENEGVVGGDAYIYTYESPSGAAFSSVSTSSSNVTVSPMDDAGRAYTGWEKGTKIDVCFPEVFEKSENYYVLLDPGAFRLNENLSKSISNASLITFRVKDYGFEPFSTDVAAGDDFSLKVRLGGDAVSANCECLALSTGGILKENENVMSEEEAGSDSEEGSLPSPLRLTQDGEYAPDLSSFGDCAAALKVTYYNEQGTAIDSSTFVLSVGSPLADDLAKVKGSVYGTPEAAEVVDTGDAVYTENTDRDDTSSISGGAASVVIDEPLPGALEEDTSDPADAVAGFKAPTDAERAQAGEDANFNSASVTERIHAEVDKAIKGRKLTADEKGALIVETLNTLAEEGLVREGTPFYDSNSESVTYVDINGNRESTKV